MKKALEIALGIMTSIGGFLDAGALATAAGAGALFGFQLLWVIVLGTICVIFLVEMSGRVAAISKHTLVDAIRERFGIKFFMIPFIAEIIVDFLVLTSEMGGVCIALQLLTGIAFQWWAFPVAFAVWLLMWKTNFSIIENSTALLGLITLCFVVAAWQLHPNWHTVAMGLVPTLPHDRLPQYLFMAVAILGALLSPYLFYFYSSGAIEDGWSKDDLFVNRVVSGLGMSFGSMVAIGVLIVSACVLHPQGIQVDSYKQAAPMLEPVFGHWGLILFAVSLGVACFGAALEVNLDTAYIIAQTFGWNWGENKRPKQAARFSTVYTVFVFLSAILVACGLDPLKLTLFSMILTAVILPVVVFPFLIVMNDEHYMGKHTNGLISNTVVIIIVGMALLMALAALPLEIVGG